MINNATKYEILKNGYVSEWFNCSFFYPCVENISYARATIHGKNVLLFKLSETNGKVDLIIKIPDGFYARHYFNAKETFDCITKNAHLTYHGGVKKKKLSGEIHLKNNGVNRFSGLADKVAAPLSFSDVIKKYPLPICRLEFSNDVNGISPSKSIDNFFELAPNDIFFNTVEVYLAQVDFLRSIAHCLPSSRNILGTFFVMCNTENNYTDRLNRRVGLYPQVLALQIKKFELIIIAAHEYKNKIYNENTLRYFHTQNYFENLINRSCLLDENGWFVDLRSGESIKPNHKRLIDII